MPLETSEKQFSSEKSLTRETKPHTIVEETPPDAARCWFLAAFPPCCDAGGTQSGMGEKACGERPLRAELTEQKHQLVGRKMVAEGKNKEEQDLW